MNRMRKETLYIWSIKGNRKELVQWLKYNNCGGQAERVDVLFCLWGIYTIIITARVIGEEAIIHL